MRICVCSTVWLVEGRAQAGRRAREKGRESESLSVRASNLVRVPGRPGFWARGRRPGGVSGIRLRDEWAGDEWREAAAAKSLLRSKRPSGGRLDRGRVIVVAKRYGTRPGLGLRGCRSCCPFERTGGEENSKVGGVEKGRFGFEVRFLSFSIFVGGGNFGS